MNEIITQPNNIQIERAILCCMMLDNDIISLSNVKADWFYSQEYKKIYEGLLQLQKERKVIDVLTLSDVSGIDTDTLFEISTELMSSTGWKEYEDILLELFTKRKLLKVSQSIQAGINEQSSDDMLMKMRNILNSMDIKDNGIGGYELLISTLEDITTSQSNICDYGYPLLDKYLGGYKEGQLIVLAGRPGFGKTALIIELMQRVLQQDKRATIYSLEMGNKELIERLLSNWTELPTQVLSKESNQQIIAERASPKSDLMKNAMFYDKVFDFNSLERSIRRGAIIKGHNIVFVDHLGLIRSNIKTTNRNQEIGYMTSSLKTLAKELGIAIVILSQLNRNVEKRSDEPELSDLRDSGNIEQDADIVIMLHREKDMDGHYDNSKFDLLIRKNRKGNLARIAMGSELAKMKITELPLKPKRG